MLNYTNHNLKKLEQLFNESSYIVRYEKGNFQAGYCILESKKVVIVNKYFTLEGKINCLLDIVPLVEIEEELLTEKSQQFLKLIKQQGEK